MRVMAAVAVAFFHSASNLTFKMASSESPAAGDLVTVMTLTFLVKVAVDLFIMVSGAFILASPGVYDLKSHAQKTWKRLGIPTAIFTVIYLLQNYLVWLRGIKEGVERFQTTPKEMALKLLGYLLKGETASHLWYLYLLIALYLMAPLIKKLLELTEGKHLTLAVILILWGWVSHMTGGNYLNWDLGFAAENSGFFVLGYALHEKYKGKKEHALRRFLLAALVLLIHFAGMAAFKGNTYLSAVFAPETLNGLTALEASLVFTGFMAVEPKKDWGRLSSYTYGVYLIHPLIGTLIAAVWAPVCGISFFDTASAPASALLNGAAVTVISFVLVHLWKSIRDRKTEKVQDG